PGVRIQVQRMGQSPWQDFVIIYIIEWIILIFAGWKGFKMGAWGNNIYDNDIALDVKEMIDRVLNEISDDYEARKVIVDTIKEDYADEDDGSIAWLVAAEQLIAGFNARKIYTMLLNDERIIDADKIEKEILEEKLPTKKMRKKPNFVTSWKPGDIYVYDVSDNWRNDPAFQGMTFGFYCIDIYEFDGVFPIAYAFRTKYNSDELYEKPELALSGSFWRVANFKEKGFMYRMILYHRKRTEIPENRLHYCGNISQKPDIKDEYIAYDKIGSPIFYWSDVEERILYTRTLQQ
ncbi:MAG: DUF4259 domain-containing protein, partial [Clostridia bacterium]|nr:DUF4259 domain-containing protein [Clostridia bacterium]